MRWDGFVDDHRKDFLGAFPDRQGSHFCRIGDGFAAISGWSMILTHRAHYLGQPATNKTLTLRVIVPTAATFKGPSGKIAENICLDYGDLFR